LEERFDLFDQFKSVGAYICNSIGQLALNLPKILLNNEMLSRIKLSKEFYQSHFSYDKMKPFRYTIKRIERKLRGHCITFKKGKKSQAKETSRRL